MKRRRGNFFWNILGKQYEKLFSPENVNFIAVEEALKSLQCMITQDGY